MTFLWPRLLWLLAILPMAAGAYLLILRRKKAAALRYSALSIAKEALGRGSRWRRRLPPAILLLALALMIVAVARPQAKLTLPSDSGTAILAMDISGSMRARDVQPSRFEAMREAARDFVKAQPGSVRIGIVAFAATATLVQAPTADKEAVLAAIERFQMQRGTAVGSGIIVSLGAIFEGRSVGLENLEPGLGIGPPDAAGNDQGQPGGRGTSLDQAASPAAPPPAEPGSLRSAAIILLTDGQTNTGPDPLTAARKAADLGVRVFTVGLGTARGQVIGFGGFSMRAQLDEKSLQGIADITRAKYFKAGSGDDLKQIYRQLGGQIGLEKAETEITALFTGLAAAMVLLSALLSMLWFSRAF